jgi:hypothetical protein
MNAGLILLVCRFVGLAIAGILFARSRGKSHSGQRWVTKDLYRGDLHILADMVRGSGLDVTYDQIARLKNRGFVKNNLWGTLSVTFKGYFAFILRMTVARDRPAPAEKHRVSP